MKPLKIEFQAFGPYKNLESVDFRKMESQGLFLICGKTGIGKTMILDALTFALYGKSSGHGRDDFEAMRCTNADYNKATFVKFEFENQGIYYLFERRLERKRTKLSASYGLQRKNEEGAWVPLLENPKATDLNRMAAEIIGLEYDQFRQVIVLPQGQFEKLLTSNSEEKEKILTSIFGEEKWQIIADKMFEQASNKKAELEEIKKRIQTSLDDENCANLMDLDLCIQHKKTELDTLMNEFASVNYEKEMERLQNLLTLIAKFSELHQHEESLRALNEAKGDRDLKEKRLKDAQRAEKVRKPIEDIVSARKESQNRADAEIKAVEDEVKKKSAYDKAVEKYDELVNGESDIESKKTLKIQYEDKKPNYLEIEETLTDLRDAEKRRRAKEKERSRMDASVKKATEGISLVRSEYESLRKVHEGLLESYLAGITGELAKDLKDGIPCPVCGSVDHPHKAEVSDESVSKTEVDEAKENFDAKYEELNQKIKDHEEAKKAFDSATADLSKIDSEIAEKKAKVEKTKAGMVEGIATIDELESKILKLGKEIEEYGRQKGILENSKNSLGEKWTAAKTQIQNAKEEKRIAGEKLSVAEKVLRKALKDNGFDSEEDAKSLMMDEAERDQLKADITEYDTKLKAETEEVKTRTQELKGIEEPNEQQCKDAQNELQQKQATYQSNKVATEKEISRLSEKYEKLKKDGDGLDAKIMKAAEDFAFAKKLRGDSGTGIQRYVLGIMFSSVIAAANKMLEMVHGGRYQLFRSDDKVAGTNKRGLDLKVFDSNSAESEGRFVSTLSGGEKFLASLALSIGMSTIAQKSGIKIEALFIDEGFGSLDEDSIGDAMNILGSIQKANGLVGIISHVQLLQDRIPSKLVVKEDGNGSHIVQTIG